MTPLNSLSTDQPRRPRQDNIGDAPIDRNDDRVNSRDRFEAALAKLAEQRRPALTADSTPSEAEDLMSPEERQAPGVTAATEKKPKFSDNKMGRLSNSSDSEREPTEVAPNLERFTLMRFTLSDGDQAPSGVTDMGDAGRAPPWPQAGMSFGQMPAPAGHTVHTFPELTATAAQLHNAAFTPPAETRWEFEISGDRWPVSTLLIQRSEGTPLQVGLQNQNVLGTKLSAMNLQRLRERLELQGARLMEWEGDDTP